MISIVTGGESRSGEALLVIEAKDHELGHAVKPGFYKGTIEISVRKDDALVVHVFPVQMDSKRYSKTLRSLLGKKLTQHFIGVANDNIGLGGSIVRSHRLSQLNGKKVKRIVKRATSERRLQPHMAAPAA